MKRPSKIWAGIAAVVLACAFLAPSVPAQQGAAEKKRPHIAFVYPAGGQAGTTIEVVVGGENVYGATAAVVSGKGVAVQVTDAAEPESAKDPDKKKQKKKNQTVLDEIVKLKVTLAPDAAPGDREICLAAPGGVSNKLVFQVGQLAEAREAEPNDRRTPNPLPPLPVTVNGRIMPGDEDLFRFSAKKGQRLVFEVSARALIPYIADAVPGWFQAILTLRDAQGRELAVADSFRFRQDPVLFCEIPADGEYLLEIRDSIYRGREDFVYRVRIGELPFITDVFPLGAPHGTRPVAVKLSGWNLPPEPVMVDVGPDAPPVRQLSVTRGGLVSNSVPFAVGDLPEVAEDEGAARRPRGQKVLPPVVVNGRILTPGETDSFRFPGKKGQAVCLEVRARRLGSPLDSRLTLLDADGKTIAENDDVKDPAEGLLTHQADSELPCTLPADGTYTVRITDTLGRGGDEYAYRLRIGPPVPDFALRTTPAAVSVPAGGSAELNVHVLRRDGFAGEIRLAMEAEFAAGLRLDGAVVPAGVDSVRVTISAPGPVPVAMFFPKLTGTAVVEGRTLVRPAVPAEDLMQAFIYMHLTPFREWLVAVADPPVLFAVAAQLPPDGVLALPQGREVSFPVTATRRPGFDGPVRLQLVDPPKGITIRKGFIPAGKDSALVTIRTEAKTGTGLRGNLIFAGSTPIEREATPEERARIKAQEARKAAAAAGTVPAAVPGAAKPGPAAPAVLPKPDAEGPLMITRPLIFTLPAVPFRVTEDAAKSDGKKAPPSGDEGKGKKNDAGKNRKK
jgi:hypothetical protein